MSENSQVRLTTTGMHCPSCSMLIKMSVEDLDGVSAADSDYRSGETVVTYDPQVVTIEEILAEITKAGYGAEVAK